MDYKSTPSYYNNKEYFDKYLGSSSYYNGLQENFTRVIGMSKAKNILELGSALGTTTMTLARRFPAKTFVGTDIREDIVAQANKDNTLDNVTFKVADMCEIAKRSEVAEYDLIYALYSFHHIPDPLDLKVEFLQNIFKRMKEGAYLLIGETFLPEKATRLKGDNLISERWNERAVEGGASTFWNALENLSPEGIALAKEVSNVSLSEESMAGALVFNRTEEYLVKASWLKEEAEKVGFKVIIAEPMNSIGEHILLFRK